MGRHKREAPLSIVVRFRKVEPTPAQRAAMARLFDRLLSESEKGNQSHIRVDDGVCGEEQAEGDMT